MSSSSSPLFGFGWERPGGAVDAESFPFRRERIHYLCPEVTIWTSEYWNLQTASNRQKRLGFHSNSRYSIQAWIECLRTNLCWPYYAEPTSYFFELDQSTFVYMPPIKKDKSLYYFNSQRAHSMNKAFLFCGTCTQSWRDQLDLTEKPTFWGFFGYISGTDRTSPKEGP